VAPPNLRERERAPLAAGSWGRRREVVRRGRPLTSLRARGGRAALEIRMPAEPAPPSRSTPVGERRGDCWLATRERSYPPQAQARCHHRTSARTPTHRPQACSLSSSTSL
jgi:hypothetical protein